MRKVGENANVECSSFSSCAALFFFAASALHVFSKTL